MKEFEPQYRLIIDRVDNLDTLKVQAELRNDYFKGDMGQLAELENLLAHQLKSVLSIRAKVQLMPSGSLERSQNKSNRVIDNRKFE